MGIVSAERPVDGIQMMSIIARDLDIIARLGVATGNEAHSGQHRPLQVSAAAAAAAEAGTDTVAVVLETIRARTDWERRATATLIIVRAVEGLTVVALIPGARHLELDPRHPGEGIMTKAMWL